MSRESSSEQTVFTIRLPDIPVVPLETPQAAAFAISRVWKSLKLLEDCGKQLLARGPVTGLAGRRVSDPSQNQYVAFNTRRFRVSLRIKVVAFLKLGPGCPHQ